MTRLSRLVGAAMVASLLGVAWATPVAAAQYYQTTASVNFRAGPGTTWRVTSTVGAGTGISIDCQVQDGTSVGGNRTWDHMTNGQWVSDFYTTTPSFNSYIWGMPKCTREWRALAWASAQLYSHADDYYCERFVEHAFGVYGVPPGYTSALADYRAQLATGHIHTDLNPPAGALVFYRNAYDGGNGHVELSRGDGSYLTTSNGGGVQIVSFSWGGSFQGWSWVQSNWSGRN
jgi:hypothetical protein